MSAGICIMNKNAIVLAADSAVTIGQHLAIHNSANKLFALSKVAPIGVIIYSNAELMGIPMELIIKQYKSELRNKVFPNLSDYVTDFLQFLILKSNLFRFPDNEKAYVTNVYVDLLNGLNGDYQLSIKRKINEIKRDLTAEELQEIQVETVRATLMFVDQLATIPNLELHDYIKNIYIARKLGNTYQYNFLGLESLYLPNLWKKYVPYSTKTLCVMAMLDWLLLATEKTIYFLKCCICTYLE